MHVYNSEFYNYISAGSRMSARTLIPLMRSVLPVDSLLDVGAGQGAWAAEWRDAGVPDVVAVDGTYVNQDALLIPRASFVAHDLSKPLDLSRRFDLVQSLEVAEHIDAKDADTFVDTLAAHGDVVMFSAAVPHQGGEHHVNEQLPEYWRRKFAARGYDAFDWLRPKLRDDKRVMPWYKFNSILYANAEGQEKLATQVLAHRVPDDAQVPVGGSLRWNIRRGVIRLMPASTISWMAMANASIQSRKFKYFSA